MPIWADGTLFLFTAVLQNFKTGVCPEAGLSGQIYNELKSVKYLTLSMKEISAGAAEPSTKTARLRALLNGA